MYRVISCSHKRRGLSNIFCNTQNMDSSKCIDTTSTGASFYDDFLDSSQKKYLERKNLRGQIQMMTPLEYYEACAKIFNSSVESLMRSRKHDASSIEYLTNAIESGRKFHLPYVNFAQSGQEGLHRMMVLGDAFGWDEKFPVLVVNYIDPKKQELDEIRKDLRRAINESIQYRYAESNLPDELVSQIQWELDKHDEDAYIVICLRYNSTKFIISVKGHESDIQVEIDKSDLNYREDDSDTDDDFDIDEELMNMSLEELLKL